MNISRNDIINNLGVIKSTLIDLTKNDNPGKSVTNKIKFYTSIKDQKLTVLYVILGRAYEKDKTRMELLKESLIMNRAELMKHIRSYLQNNKGAKLTAALGLVLSDSLQETLIATPAGLILGRSLGSAIYKLIDKVLDIFYKNELSPEAKENMFNKIERNFKSEEKSRNDFLHTKQYITNKIAPSIGIMLIIYGISGYIEEVSKGIAAELGIGQLFTSIFIVIENLMYSYTLASNGMTAKDIVKMRVPSILMHIVTSILHEIPQLAKYAYIIHPIFNVISTVIMTRKSINKVTYREG